MKAEEVAMRRFHPEKLPSLDKTLDVSLELLSLHSEEKLIELCPGYDVFRLFSFFFFTSPEYRGLREVSSSGF